MQRIVKLPSVANVAAAATASLACPVGGVIYDAIILTLTNITLAQLTNIELRLNGKPVQKFASGTELDQINQFYGRGASANGILTLHLARPELALVEQQRLTSIGTADLATMDLQMEIAAGVTNPGIVAHAVQSVGQAELGLITKVKRFPFNSAVSGQVEVDSIPRTGARIAAVHLVKSDVDAVEIDVNSIRVYEGSKTLGEQVQTQAGRTPQTANMTHVDFLLEGDIWRALRTKGVQDLRVRPTLGTSGAFDLVVEYLDGLEGI